MDGDSYRKASISNKLSKLITENPDFSVAQLIRSVMRTKNIRSDEKDNYFMSDEDFLIAVESTAKELKENPKEVILNEQ